MILTINAMKPIRYDDPVRNSEQKLSSAPLHPAVAPEKQSVLPPLSDTFRANLIRHAIFRDQVQTAISELIRGYEATTGLSVLRLEYHPENHHVTLDAIPAAS
jgi:hypothetical protein